VVVDLLDPAGSQQTFRTLNQLFPFKLRSSYFGRKVDGDDGGGRK
jgi:hypothetical protein